ncbi:MAG: glycosyltransferase [Patescibacteria group bacterium]
MKRPNIVTVVTPSFNQGSFIEETIKSVLTQKGDFFIDYIIMDGGSCDNTLAIIKKYEKLIRDNCSIQNKMGHKVYVSKDRKFRFNKCFGISYRFVSKKDNGQVDALKKGFKKSKGDILCWLNSDDFYIGNGVFDKVFKYFNGDRGLKMLTTDGIFVDKEGQKTGIHHVSRINVKELLYLDYHILQPSTFIKKEIYNEKYLNEKYVVAFDGDFFTHLILNGHKFRKTNDVLSAFRFYSENKTLGLAKKALFEEMWISWTYSKNAYLFMISFLYRYFEKVLNPKIGGNRIFAYLYAKVRSISYRIIINQKYEERFS